MNLTKQLATIEQRRMTARKNGNFAAAVRYAMQMREIARIAGLKVCFA